MRDRIRKVGLILLLIGCGATVLGVLGSAINRASFQSIDVSLEDLVENPERYEGERRVSYSIVTLSSREDPYRRLVEDYYLVTIRDSDGYEGLFVISERDYEKYKPMIGERVLFDLKGSRGPGLIHPPDRLITNILVSKALDPYSREFFTIHIDLAKPIGEESLLDKSTFTILASAGIILIAIASLLIVWPRNPHRMMAHGGAHS